MSTGRALAVTGGLCQVPIAISLLSLFYNQAGRVVWKLASVTGLLFVICVLFAAIIIYVLFANQPVVAV